MMGTVQAGHVGLLASYGWAPVTAYFLLKICRQPKTVYSVGFAVGLAGAFYTHTIVFMILVFASTIFLLLCKSFFYIENKRKSFLHFILGGILTFGLTAVTMLPQYFWMQVSTRQILLSYPDVYPKWHSISEYISIIFAPWIHGVQGMRDIGTEKWIALGIFPSIFALTGFWKLKRKLKLVLIGTAIGVLLISLNNSSLIYSILIKQDWYVLARVATRMWIVPVFIVSLLSAWTLDKISKRKIVGFVILGELLILSWIRISGPIISNGDRAPREVYEYLSRDKETGLYRVYCTNRCLSQRESAKYGLELVEGYNTLAQMNYYKHAWQLTGAYWNHYTLSIPPIGAYKFDKPQPDAKALGEYNTKYVVSLYPLEDSYFLKEKKIGNFYIYVNNYFQKRSNGELVKLSPNKFRVKLGSSRIDAVRLSEVYSPGWKAYINGEKEVSVQETPNSLLLVDVTDEADFVDFVYKPDSYVVGLSISTAAVIISFLLIGRQYFLLHKEGRL